MALAPLVVAVALAARRADRSARDAFGLGVTAGIVYFTLTLYWVVAVMQAYGGLPWLVAAAVGGLLAAYLALYVGLFALVLRQAVRQFGASGVWLAPVFWVASEWARSTIGGGFPWALLGSSQAPVLPVVQLVSVTGVYGLSALLALAGTAAAACVVSRHPVHRRAAAGVALLVIAAVGWGSWRVSDDALIRDGQPARIGLVQASVAQDDKGNPALQSAILARYVDLSRQVLAQGASVVIWPEAATPFFFDLDSALAAPIRRLARETGTPFVIGTDELEPATRDRPERYYNSAVLVAGDGRTHATYRKQRLVPFGEFVPFKSLLFFVGPLIEAVSDFSPGSEAVVFDAGGRRISVAICYEAIFPDVARTFVQDGSELLATITNDAWFGRSSAAYQHFDQAALRAVEQGRYLVRSANTGISGAVDPYGRVIARTPLFEPEALTVDVRLRRSRTIYNRTGDVVAWLSTATTIVFVLAGAITRRTRAARLPA